MARLGFILLTFQPPDPVFLRLLARLKELPDAMIAVHHDYHQASFPREVIQRFGLLMVSPARRTYWSHLNNVLATFDCFKLLSGQTQPPDWYITITPTCYPIKPPARIVDFFQNADADLYMDMRLVNPEASGLEMDTWIMTDIFRPLKFRLPFISKQGRFKMKEFRFKRPLKDIPFQGGVKVYHGSNYFMLSRRAVETLMQADIYNHPFTEFYRRMGRSTDMHPCPQEILVQSYFGNYGRHLKWVSDNHRFIEWEPGIWHPHDLSAGHFEALRDSKALFARKFVTGTSDALLDRIDRQLLQVDSLRN